MLWTRTDGHQHGLSLPYTRKLRGSTITSTNRGHSKRQPGAMDEAASWSDRDPGKKKRRQVADGMYATDLEWLGKAVCLVDPMHPNRG